MGITWRNTDLSGYNSPSLAFTHVLKKTTQTLKPNISTNFNKQIVGGGERQDFSHCKYILFIFPFCSLDGWALSVPSSLLLRRGGWQVFPREDYVLLWVSVEPWKTAPHHPACSKDVCAKVTKYSHRPLFKKPSLSEDSTCFKYVPKSHTGQDSLSTSLSEGPVERHCVWVQASKLKLQSTDYSLGQLQNHCQ